VSVGLDVGVVVEVDLRRDKAHSRGMLEPARGGPEGCLLFSSLGPENSVDGSLKGVCVCIERGLNGFMARQFHSIIDGCSLEDGEQHLSP
jgi:hypothetical protein